MQLMPPCLQPAADAADASCALLVCLAIGAKSKLPKPKLYPILAALKPCAAHNLSQYKRRENNGAASSVTRATSSVVRAAPRKSRYGLRGVKGAAVLFAALLWPGSPERGPAGESIVPPPQICFPVTDLPIAVGGFAT